VRLAGPLVVLVAVVVWFVLPLRYHAGRTDRSGRAEPDPQ